MGFKVYSYNLGTDENDWRFAIPPENESEFNQENYSQVVASATEKLLRQENKASVYCLQEVNAKHAKRPILEKLQTLGYKIIHATNLSRPDCVIAIDENEFSNIENCSIGSAHAAFPDVAIANATHRLTGKQFTFISAHISGFGIEEDGPTTPGGPEGGDEECKAIAKKISNFSSTIIFGADMNANPERWKKRFDILTDPQVGFQVHRTNAPTALFYPSKTYVQRELDFFFSKASSPANRTSSFSSWLFGSYAEPTVQISNLKPLNLDFRENPSDHLPIVAKVSIRVETPSIFVRILSFFSKFFGWS